MATATVTHIVLSPSGTPVPDVTVTAKLYPHIAIATGPDKHGIAGQATTTSDATGQWTLELERTDTMDPQNMSWEIEQSSVSTGWRSTVFVAVPAGGGALADLVIQPPTVPSYVVTGAGAGSTGFANPMTTAGDQIVGGGGGVATRKAKGADGTYWQIDATSHLPVWAAPPPSSSPTSQFLGKNAIGAVRAGNWPVGLQIYKKITAPKNGWIMTLDTYVTGVSAGDGTSPLYGVLDDMGGVPGKVLFVTSSSGANGTSMTTMMMNRVLPRWVSLPCGLYVTAGDYWVGCTHSFPSAQPWLIYYDNGGHDPTAQAAVSWIGLSDYAAVAGAVVLTADSGRDYSIRASFMS